jgi:hypothetical protein
VKIRVYDHPMIRCQAQDLDAPSLAEWLLQRYGAVQERRLQIYAGQVCGANELELTPAAIMAANAPEYVVLESPGDGGFITSLVISAVLSVASKILAPDPTMPANVNRTQQSPNNSLGARENQVRLLQRVEDIYGTVKAIPSLMMQTYIKYVGTRQVEYGYYCISRGYLDVTDVKDGESFLSEIQGSSAAIYAPFTSPNSGHAPQALVGDPIIDAIVTVRRSVETDGFTLKALNQIQLTPGEGYRFHRGGGSEGPLDVIVQEHKWPNFNAIAEVGQTVTVAPFSDAYTLSQEAECVGADRKYIDRGVSPSLFRDLLPGGEVTFSGWIAPQNNGTFIIATKVDDFTITVTSGSQVDEVREIPTLVTVHAVPDRSSYWGTRTITEVRDGAVVLDGVVFARDLGVTDVYRHVNIAVDNGLSDWTDWVTLPDANRNQVWFNVIATQGMKADAGGESPVFINFQAQIEQLDGGLSPTGNVEDVLGGIGGATSDQIGETLERVTGWTGPARARMRRVTPYLWQFPGTIIDEIKWSDLYSVAPVTKAHFGNKTTIHTVTRATPRATSVRSRQLNCIASRRLPRWTGSGFSGAFDAEGRHVSGTIEATNYLHDIIAAICLDPKIGRREVGELDMVQMSAQVDLAYAVHASIPRFNYTFDSEETSLEEMIFRVADAGSCTAYRQNGRIRLFFDRAQAASTALISHRNSRPGSQTITRVFANDADYDGVEFVYQDPDTGQAETIRLPTDGDYTKLKRFEIPGIRNFAQAWLRANRELAKLRGQRISVQVDMTTDARSLLPGARVDIVDNTVFASFDGEVVGKEDFELELSRDVTFTPAVDHSIVLMCRDGSLESIRVTPGSEPNRVVLQHAPVEAVVTQEGQDGIRTIFSFAADDARQAQAYQVTEIGASDGQYMQVRAINYDAGFYSADTLPIPPRDSVIN